VDRDSPRVLITGARGFIGRHVVRKLRSVPGIELIEDRRPEDGPGIDLLDRSAVQRLVNLGHISHVVHACGSHPQRSAGDLFLVHAVTTQHLLDALAHAGQVVRWINVGSAAQYGRQDRTTEPELGEAHADQALSPYAVSKAAQEQLVASAAQRGFVQPTFLRVFNAIGPGQAAPLLVPAILGQLGDRSASALRLGNLACVRDFVDVRDVADAIVACLQSPPTSGQKLNVCSGSGTGVGEIAGMLLAAAGRGRTLRVVEVPMPSPAILYQRGSRRRIEALCGWRPRYALWETVRDIWEAASP
jgi:nucleoside-diphosphate-sugar epimerase